MILKIYESKSKQWIYYENIEDFHVIKPYENIVWLENIGETIKENQSCYKPIHYNFCIDVKRQVLNEEEGGANVISITSIVHRLLIDLNEPNVIAPLVDGEHYPVGLMMFHSGENDSIGGKLIVFSNENRDEIYLLNNEGKTIDRIA